MILVGHRHILYIIHTLLTAERHTSLLLIYTGMQRKVKQGFIRHAYWILNTIATDYSFVITFFYWTMLHDPGRPILNQYSSYYYCSTFSIRVFPFLNRTR